MNSCNFLGPKIKPVPKLAETGGTGVPKKQASRSGKYLPHIGSMQVQDTPKFLDSCQANLTTTNAWKHDKPVTMYLLL